MQLRVAVTTLVLAGTLSALGPASAQDHAGASDADKQQAAELQTVVVTGTRARDRSAADSLAPIDVLTTQDLAATGAPNLDSALRILLPSFNFPQPSINGDTDATQPAQLRGLSPDQTLVLIDGKRQHTTAQVMVTAPLAIGRGSSPVDLAAIPLNAIERIEVLRDGAAAQYGSDAIAGVINIILKKGARHGAVSAGYGVHDGGQGRTWRGGADGGFKLRERGWVRLAANYLDQDPTNHAAPDRRYPGDPTFNTVTVRYGLPREIARQAAVNLQYRFGAGATLYGLSIFNKRDVRVGESFRAVSTYAADHPAAAALYPRGFLPIQVSAIRDDNTVLGLRGELGAWHYDVSADLGGNHVKPHTTHSFNFSLGEASPGTFYTGTLAIRQKVFNADFTREFDMPWNNPLTLAWGLAWRHEKFTIKPGAADSYTGTGGEAAAGFTPADAGSHTRSDRAAYVDLETDFTDRLAAGFAARHEHYSDFGDTTSWKLSGRFAFTPAVAMRGTLSTGFRAPSLQQEFYSSTGLVFDNPRDPKHPDRVRTFPVADPAAVALGAQPLKPETSRNASVGLVFTPAVGPYVTLDLYRIDIDARILLSGDLIGDQVREYLASAGIPHVSGGRFFTNAVDTRTRGADLVVTWPLALARSPLKLAGGANWNRTSIRAVKPNPPQLGLAGLELPVIDRTERGRLTTLSPRSKAFVGAAWRTGPWRVRARLTRYGRWTYLGAVPAFDQTYAARVLLDASVGFVLGDWTFTLGGNDVTNTYPEKNNATTSFGGILTYPASSPFGFNGAYGYANAAWHW